MEDARRKLGLEMSGKAGRASGRRITKGLAVRYPPGADAWRNGEIVERFLSGERIRWKYVEGEGPDSYTTWPRNGFLEGTVAEFAGSAADASADVDRILEAGVRAASLIRGAAAGVLDVLKHHPGEIERINWTAPCTPAKTRNAANWIWPPPTSSASPKTITGRPRNGSPTAGRKNPKSATAPPQPPHDLERYPSSGGSNSAGRDSMMSTDSSET